MFREEGSGGGDRRNASRNVFGEPLETCATSPMTGFYRDGCCNTGIDDVGSHTVCIVATAEFLAFSKSRGNDLSTPLPNYGFPGLHPPCGGALGQPERRDCLVQPKDEFSL
jgi:hypothetical protein